MEDFISDSEPRDAQQIELEDAAPNDKPNCNPGGEQPVNDQAKPSKLSRNLLYFIVLVQFVLVLGLSTALAYKSASQSEVEQQHNDDKSLLEKIEQLQGDIKRKQVLIEQQRDDVKSKQEKIALLQDDIQSKQGRIDKLEQDWQAQLSASQSLKDQTSKELSENRQTISSLEAQAASLTNQLDKSQKEQDEGENKYNLPLKITASEVKTIWSGSMKFDN